MWRRVSAGTVAGLLAAFVVDIVMLGHSVMGLNGQRLSPLAVVAEAAHAHGALAGGLIALAYGGALGGLFGWLVREERLTELSGLFRGLLYGVSWSLASSLIVAPLLQGEIPFGPSALVLMVPAFFDSAVGHVLYGAVLGVAFGVITSHVARPREQARPQAVERRAA